MNVLGFILIVSGLLVVTYFSGPKSSSEQSNPPPQGQVQALPVNSPSPTNTGATFDYAGAKAAGYSDAEIQNYLASKQGGIVTPTMEPMHNITNNRTGQTIQVPQSQLGSYGITLPNDPTRVTRASDRAVRLSTLLFLYAGDKRLENIKKYANGTDNLPLAINNLALELDANPQRATVIETVLTDHIAKMRSLNSTFDLEWKLHGIENQLDDIQSRLKPNF